MVRTLKQTGEYQLLLLSNVNKSHWKYGLSRDWKFEELFDEVILSHKVFMTKPNPKIYQLAIERAGCEAREIVFIDDNIINIKGAQVLGLNSIHFKDCGDLIERFREFEIIISV